MWSGCLQYKVTGSVSSLLGEDQNGPLLRCLATYCRVRSRLLSEAAARRQPHVVRDSDGCTVSTSGDYANEWKVILDAFKATVRQLRLSVTLLIVLPTEILQSPHACILSAFVLSSRMNFTVSLSGSTCSSLVHL
jgi:hypothetical protein